MPMISCDFWNVQCYDDLFKCYVIFLQLLDKQGDYDDLKKDIFIFL